MIRLYFWCRFWSGLRPLRPEINYHAPGAAISSRSKEKIIRFYRDRPLTCFLFLIAKLLCRYSFYHVTLSIVTFSHLHSTIRVFASTASKLHIYINGVYFLYVYNTKQIHPRILKRVKITQYFLKNIRILNGFALAMKYDIPIRPNNYLWVI